MPDITIYLIAAALVVFVFFQFRTSRKRAKETAARLQAIVPGVEIMTNYGLFGTVQSIDEANNFAFIEVAPGTIVKIHRSTILKPADAPVDPSDELADETSDDAVVADSAIELNTDHAIPAGEPQFGERVDSDPTKTTGTAPKKSDD
jgi:preprotein translocase subunit YajC